jgi:apolipoprotein N-acyltransferase
MPLVENVRLRLVQPNTDQAKKWAVDDMEPNFQHILSLTSASSEKPATHIIWPETAATFYLTEDNVHRKAIAAHLQPGGLVLTGVVRRSLDASQHLHYYNSLIAIDDKARVIAAYDKIHLVPFGEYMPGRRFIPLRTLANLGLDFTAGDGLRSLRVPNLPSFSALICYEAIFSGEVVDESDRPAFLLNVTNDGWYGKTAGPYQHFSIVMTRAVEEGLPLVRAANTGISGVVDGYGRMIAHLGLGEASFVDSDLPQALAPTFFSRYGEWPMWGLFILSAAFVLFQRDRQHRSS